MGAIANLASRSVVVAPGAQANTEIRVRNNGTVVDQFTIAVLGDATAWSAAEPPVVSLFPGAEQVVRVTFRPPRSPDVPAGPMAFGVRVLSQEDPAGSVVEEGVLQIGAFSDTSAELAPQDIPRTDRARPTTWPSTTGATRSSTRPSPGSTRTGPSRSTSSRRASSRSPAPRRSRRSASSRASGSGAASPRLVPSSCSSTAPDSRPSSSRARCSRSRSCPRGSSRRCC